MKQSVRLSIKKHNLLVIALVSLVLTGFAATLTYITQKNHQQAQHITALRTEITTVHHELGTIAKDLERQTGYMWKDESECYTIKARQFGDKVRYACEVRYTIPEAKIVEAHYRTLLESTYLVGRKVIFNDEIVQEGYTQPTALIDMSPWVKRASYCRITYSYHKDRGTIYGSVYCHYSPNLEEYVKLLGILPEGEERA